MVDHEFIRLMIIFLGIFSGFLNNTGAVAGVFSTFLHPPNASMSAFERVAENSLILAIVGLVGLAGLVGLVILCLKKRRARRFDRELSGERRI